MPLHSYFVMSAFVLLGVILMVRLAGLGKYGYEFMGRPSIDRYHFYSGKITLFITWGLFLIKAILPKLGYIRVPAALSWAATAILLAASVLTAFAITGLGSSLKMGLPDTPTALQTGGIFRFSRNPMYTGFFMIVIASCLYFPDLINVSFAIYSIHIHHRIILAEEEFLAGCFGREYTDYRSRVRRYL